MADGSIAADGNLLLEEQHHRVQNLLQLVQSVLSKAGRSAPVEAALAFREVQAQITGFAVLNDLLRTSSGDYAEGTCCAAFLSRLAAVLETSCLAPRGVALVRRLPERLDADARTCRHLGLILIELVFNAAKHAFPNGGGTIAVTLTNERDTLRLTVADDGVGLPPRAPTPTETSGKGRRFVDMLAASVGATVACRSSGLGTTFEVVVPILAATVSTTAP